MYHQAGESIGGAINELQAHDDLQTTIAMSQKANEIDSQLTQEYPTKRADPNFNLQDWQAHVAQSYAGVSNVDEQGTFGSLLGHSDKILAYAANIQDEGVTRWSRKALGDQMQLDGARALQTVNDSLQTQEKQIYADPTQLGQAATTINARVAPLLVAGGLSAKQLADEGTNISNRFAGAALEGILNNIHTGNMTPDQIKTIQAQVNDQNSTIWKMATKDQLRDFNTRLENAHNTQSTVQAFQITNTWDDTTAHIAKFGDVDTGRAQIAAYMKVASQATPEERDTAGKEVVRMQKGLDEASAKFQQQDSILKTPADQSIGYLASLKDIWQKAPPASSGAAEASYNAAQKLFAERDKAFTGPDANPSKWVMDNDQITATRYQQFQSIDAAKQPQLKAQAWDAYASTSAAIQARLYPNRAPNIVTDDIKVQAQAAIKEVQSPGGPDKAAASLAQMAQTYGRWWPSMAASMRQKNVLPPTAGVAAELISDPRKQALAETMLNAAGLTKEDIAKKNGVTEDKADKLARDALAGYANTLGNRPGADAFLADYRTALASVIQYQGVTDSTGAKKLADTMVNNDFSYVGRGSTIRVPNWIGQDAGRIADGASAVTGDIGNHNLVLPADVAGLRVNANQYARQIKATGRWYTNDTNTGLKLYDGEVPPHPVLERVGPQPNFDLTKAPGMKATGNLTGDSVWNRPVLRNADGSYSTTSSISIGTDKGETVIPTVVNGKRLSNAEAIAHFKQTGENFGSFDSVAHANAYATALHNAQAKMYDSKGNPLGGVRQVEVNWDDLGKTADKQISIRGGAAAAGKLLDKGIQAIGGQ